jgi:3-oxoadipate enol-lactonase
MSGIIKKSFIPMEFGKIAIMESGNPNSPAVILSHSILSSSMMWEEQLKLLANSGWRAIAIDTRGHGQTTPTQPPYTLMDLGLDVLGVMDFLEIDKAHFVGLSLGGMIGFSLGIHHGDRLHSLCICDARADAPPPVFNQWTDRMNIAKQQGCMALALPTIERWFGKAFLESNPQIASNFAETISNTSLNGYCGCAMAIQQMSFLSQLKDITTRTTLIVGSNDLPLPETMKDIQSRIPGSVLEVIQDAGHLSNVDQPASFNAALLRHLAAK